MELLKYIYALKPTHKYFSKDFDGEDEWCSDGSYSSEDSEFEAQFADVVKDLPPNLAASFQREKSVNMMTMMKMRKKQRRKRLSKDKLRRTSSERIQLLLSMIALRMETNDSFNKKLLC